MFGSYRLMVVALLFASACGGPDRPMSAPAFNVLDKSEVHATMWQLASDIDALDDLMTTEPGDPAKLQSDTVALLEHISASAGRLGADRTRKKHPFFDERLPFFQQAVTQALDGARSEPPNYYFAGQVAGSCVHCHDPRGGLRTH